MTEPIEPIEPSAPTGPVEPAEPVHSQDLNAEHPARTQGLESRGAAELGQTFSESSSGLRLAAAARRRGEALLRRRRTRRLQLTGALAVLLVVPAVALPVLTAKHEPSRSTLSARPQEATGTPPSVGTATVVPTAPDGGASGGPSVAALTPDTGGAPASTTAAPNLLGTRTSASVPGSTSLGTVRPVAPPVPTTTGPAAAGSPTAASRAGCPAGGTVPPGATTVALTYDVDGDGRDDTGFADESSHDGNFQVGVITASGAVLSATAASASGVKGRTATFTAVGGQVLLIADDGRQAFLFTTQGCAIRAVTDNQQEQGGQETFVLGNSGLSCGTFPGRDGNQLIRQSYTYNGPGNSADTETDTVIDITGSTAQDGPSVTMPAPTQTTGGVHCGDQDASSND